MTLEATLSNIASALERIASALEARATAAPAAAPAPTRAKKPAAAAPVAPEPGVVEDTPAAAPVAPEPEAVEDTPAAPSVELRDVQAIAVKVVNKLGLPVAQKLLKTLGSPDGRVSTLPAENRAVFVRQAESQLAVAS
jgi:hypothetical protein